MWLHILSTLPLFVSAALFPSSGSVASAQETKRAAKVWRTGTGLTLPYSPLTRLVFRLFVSYILTPVLCRSLLLLHVVFHVAVPSVVGDRA